MSALNLHVFWGEDDIGWNTRDVQTVRLVNSRANGELSDEDLGISQRFSKSLPGLFRQSEELVESNSGRDVGQLIDDVEAEGLRHLDRFSFVEGSIVPDLLRFLWHSLRLLGRLCDRFLRRLKLLNWSIVIASQVRLA